MLPRVEIVELFAKAGFSAVIIDLEHGPIEVGDLPPLSAAARASGIYSIVRISENSATEIGKTLDSGVDGVMVPHISSASDAERVVAAGRFAPAGERSINPYTRGNAYDLYSETTDSINQRVALIAMLEGADMLTSLEAICSVDGLDAVFIGPVDLAGSLGLGGESEHPDVIAAVMNALERVQAAGCASGVYAPTPSASARWVAAGGSLVALSADIALAHGAFASARSAVGDALAAESAAKVVSAREESPAPVD
jgi:4-hydroxy-2-oxoheptanedioate aldolase